MSKVGIFWSSFAKATADFQFDGLGDFSFGYCTTGHLKPDGGHPGPHVVCEIKTE